MKTDVGIELLLHTVLIKPELVEETDEVLRRARAAGIAIQLDKREEKAVEFGTVISVGPTAFKDYGRGPDILKAGDKISFAKYSGKEITKGGVKYLILNDQDCICKITGE
ncbi:MAG: co-chaperone GroES family protein [Leptolyngbyaceae bacterium]|nr:co-chaperone GroES family protein [Leptolyngbyaceae bacterium]